ncbi:MAG: adenosine kinase [Deltaproteobacteria bacterium]|nr:adenosine kinase [Deltaproteobacteria bacterium]
MKRLDVCGIGNGLVDVLLRITDQEFAALGFERATTRMAEAGEQSQLLEKFKNYDALIASGGSVANSVIAVAQLGGKAAYMGCLGDDKYGTHFESELQSLGVELANHLIANQQTGTVVALITPDGERTMRFDLGVASHLSLPYINEEVIRQSKWLFIEGYLFANSEKAHEALRHAVAIAKSADTKIAVTFSEAWIVSGFGEILREIVGHADLVFANESEACAFTGKSNAKEAFAALSATIPNVAITVGAEGSLISFAGKQHRIEAFPCTPVDLTGAGDMFAGAFLYGVTNGFSAAEAGKAGCFLSKQVITRVGPRLSSGTKDYWNECLGK